MDLKNKALKTLTAFMPLVYLALAAAVVAVVMQNGNYPDGSDTMYHVFRGNMVYNAVRQGDWWPMYNPLWYNGVELLRYWAPLPAYLAAFCQAAAGGDPLNGYLIFVGLIFYIGALVWLYVGHRLGRPLLGALLGILWFFMPNNLFVLFEHGNLSHALIMTILPLFVYAVSAYLQEPRWGYLPLAGGSFLLMLFCHLGYCGMIALSTLLYLAVYRLVLRRKCAVSPLIITMLLGFLTAGLWLLPALIGGITGIDTSENMQNFFQRAVVSLNPLERLASGNINFYFGLAAFGLAVCGVLGSQRKNMSGFATGLLIFLGTTVSMYPIIAVLPGSQYLWMLRFVSIALCLILFSYLSWDTLRRPLVILFLALLVADTLPSLSLVYGQRYFVSAQVRFDQMQEETLIRQAQEITDQRLALLDLSALEAAGAWLVSAWNEPVAATFGAGWEASNTATNIVQLNRALENGCYLYLFDRCLELGSDTVLVQTAQLNRVKYPVEMLDAAAERVGYQLVDENGVYRLYHIETGGQFGTVAQYRGIAIGTSAPAVALAFPAIEETSSGNLSDYTFDELAAYDLIYLAGFTYNDRQEAEDLILRLSEAGVHIVIAADGIPEDRGAHNRSFLGVVCNTVHFSNGYPELDTIDGRLNTDLFPQGFTEWDTVYVVGLDEVWGTVREGDLSLDFYGTVKNDNIVIFGLNLTRFYGLTQDPTVGRLLSHAMDMSPDELPQRRIVPLDIDFGSRLITITAPEGEAGINTALAWHDIFQTSSQLKVENNLLYVDGGSTIILLQYPHLGIGAAMSGAGILLTLLYWLYMRRRQLAGRQESGAQKQKTEDGEGVGL